MNTSLAFFARLLLAALFIVSGSRKIMAFQGMSQTVAQLGLPSPEFVTALVIILEIGGGLLLIFGWQARLAAATLALFTLGVTPIFHDFWSDWNGEAASFANQLNHFLKNLAVAGGLLHVAATPRVGRVKAPPEA